MPRRRPVPRDWREIHHDLRTSVTRWGGSPIAGGGLTFRTRGYCSCGAQWPTGNANNLQRDDVLDYWLDHVEAMYYHEPERRYS